MARTWILALAALCATCLAQTPQPSPNSLPLFPLAFEQNVGQADAQVQYLSHGPHSNVFLTPTEVVLGFADADALRMDWAGANPRPAMSAENEQPGKVNYFVGSDASKWRTGLPTYARVRYRGIYPGVDAVVYGREGTLEYDLVVAPGADAKQIALAFDGASQQIAPNGDLVLRAGKHEVRQHRPVIYQQTASGRRMIDGGYVLRADNRVGFQLGAYDPKLPLVIDPTLVFSTYLGGSYQNSVNGVAVDGNGNIYATGQTSYNFPTKNPIQGNQPSADAFVTKLTSGGGALVYSTYLGGNGVNETGLAIGVDRFGNAYVVGRTDSTNFPVKNAIQSTNHGRYDFFATKLNASGSALVYSTYLGGSSDERAAALAIDSQQRLYIAGSSCSPDFPVVNAYQPSSGTGVCSKPSPGPNAVVARLSTSGTSLEYSTYLGGTTGDSATGVAVDSTFHAYVAGGSSSPDFPVTPGAFQVTNSSQGKAFVTKFSADGRSLVYSTFVGGSTSDGANGIAVDSTGHAYITGFTSSADYPVTSGAFQKTLHGVNDAFVTKLAANGGSLVYSTFLGGSDLEQGISIALDGSNNAYVAGLTGSTNFPLHNALQATNHGSGDAFISKLSSTGSSLLFSTYFGGSGGEQAESIRLDSSGHMIVGGTTNSSDLRTTAGAFQRTKHGTSAGFVLKIAP